MSGLSEVNLILSSVTFIIPNDLFSSLFRGEIRYIKIDTNFTSHNFKYKYIYS